MLHANLKCILASGSREDFVSCLLHAYTYIYMPIQNYVPLGGFDFYVQIYKPISVYSMLHMKFLYIWIIHLLVHKKKSFECISLHKPTCM